MAETPSPSSALSSLGPGEQGARNTSTPLRTWLTPLVVLLLVTLVLLGTGGLADHNRGVLAALRDPDRETAAALMSSLGQVVTQVLGVAISVVAIIVELAASRYTHRITDLFFRSPVNFVVMGLFVVSGLHPLWVALTFSPGMPAPRVAVAIAMVLMSASVLLLLPYFAFVAAFVSPLAIIHRLRDQTLVQVARGASVEGLLEVGEVQRESEKGGEQLADIALNAMANHDKAIAMAAVNAIGGLLRDYLKVKGTQKPGWFLMSNEVLANPEFVSLAEPALEEIRRARTWYEFKLLREYETIYRACLNTQREIAYMVATNVRIVGEQAMERDDHAVSELAIKFFNTFLRATVNSRDVRTAYNVLNQYRLLGEALLRKRHGRQAISVARYFKYYGQLAFHMDLGFILETAAYDLCALNELAFDLNVPERSDLLKVFLQVDKEGEGEKREEALRGVRKAQVKLATYYLLRGDRPSAREVYRDMAEEQAVRMASIRDELLAVESPYFWEVTDRGANFDWMPTERKRHLLEFFEWFGDALPAPRASVLPPPMDVPKAIDASTSAPPVAKVEPEPGEDRGATRTNTVRIDKGTAEEIAVRASSMEE